MAEVFVRRTTAILTVLIVILSVICVALIVILSSSPKAEHVDKPLKSPPGVIDRYSLVSPEENKPHPHEVQGRTEQITLEKEMTTSKSTDMSQVKNDISTELKEPWEKDIRIPRSTIPYHYDLFLYPNLNTEVFTGRVSLTIGVTSPMDYLVTHVKLMNITSTELMDSSGSKYDLKDAFEYTPNEFWVVKPRETLKPGNYTLSLSFNGGLKGHIVGFYKTEYMTKSGEKRAIATSKFQPTDARRAFPCFDEPSFKSTFSVTLIRPSEGYIALSNMPVEKETPNSPSDGLTMVEFEKSVPMVTYLTCFIVCDFESVEVMTKQNKPFKVFATSDQIERTHYARDIGVHILNYFEEYFMVDYPLPKLDMIAIPDFVSGAMEHWGLITYREANLLYDDFNSSSYNKQRVAQVVSHELAHSWFGNLVTLKWWDDLWLNEGFASYIEYKGVSVYEKDWDMEDQFIIEDLQPVFRLDEILTSHPIVQPVNHPDEITEIFDTISYSKGASVLRMLENFIGQENFRNGVSNFLRRFKYDNAVTQDLWDDMQATASKGVNVTRVMDTWTRQMGFPVLYVKPSTQNENQLEITQQRFLVDPDAQSKDDSPFAYKWDIPVTFRTDTVAREQTWFKMEQEQIMVSRPNNSSWIKFNVDQFGYYRVNYETSLWNELISLLKRHHETLSPSDRSSLIDDSFSLAAAQQLPYETAFQVISYMTNETHYLPWSSVKDRLDLIGHLLRNTKAYKLYRKFVLKLVNLHVERVGWEDTGSHIERRNRINILDLACSNGHVTCLQGAVSKFKMWIEDPSYNIPANLRSIVYKFGIQGTGDTEWDELFARFQKEINAQEKIKMLFGLTSTKEPWISNRLLDLSRNNTIIRKQDFFTTLTYMSRNPSAFNNVWEFIRSNWEWIVDEFGLNNRYIGSTVRNVAFQLTSPLQMKELKSFFEEHPKSGSGKRARSQALERVEENISWVQKNSQLIYVWLKNNVS